LILPANTAPNGNIYIAAPSITLTGAVTATSSLGLQTDSFSFVSGSLTGTTVELAPLTSGTTVTLGGSGSGLSVSSAAFITATTLRIGAVTVPGSGLTTTAGPIAIGGAFNTTGISTLNLDATGAVTQTAALTGGSQLTGSAASFTLLNAGNAF